MVGPAHHGLRGLHRASRRGRDEAKSHNGRLVHEEYNTLHRSGRPRSRVWQSTEAEGYQISAAGGKTRAKESGGDPRSALPPKPARVRFSMGQGGLPSRPGGVNPYDLVGRATLSGGRIPTSLRSELTGGKGGSDIPGGQQKVRRVPEFWEGGGFSLCPRARTG